MAYTTPPTYVSGATLTAAQLNQYNRDNWKAIGDPWAAYTPSLTNWTIGNGTLTGARMLLGATVMFRVTLTLGSTSTTVGTLNFNLPATCNHPTASPIGQATLIDLSTGNSRNAVVRRSGTATTASIVFDASPAATSVNGANPWTWANGDSILITGQFEAIP